MTLKEFLLDYASEDTVRLGDEVIEREIGNIPSSKVQDIVRDRLTRIVEGDRDFRF